MAVGVGEMITDEGQGAAAPAKPVDFLELIQGFDARIIPDQAACIPEKQSPIEGKAREKHFLQSRFADTFYKVFCRSEHGMTLL